MIRQGLLALLFSMLLSSGLSSARADSFVERPEVQQFIETMADRHGFDAEALSHLFAQARPCLFAARTMTEQVAQPLPWSRYRSQFVNKRNIRHGVRFWRQNATALARARRIYGVPEEVVVAIIGVETRYGKTRSRFPEFDTLATLAFDYPRRAEYFRGELEQYLLLMREERRDPLSAKGSFAGAMGIPQFMPSSYRSYAVDFNRDGRRDLWSSTTDAIGSVANYLKAYGWEAGQPVVVRVRLPDEAEQSLSAYVSTSLKPEWSVEELKSIGLVPVERLSASLQAALLAVEGEDGREYWLGFDNFYAITRYNRSLHYALAVYQLSWEIRSARRVGH
ncbi:lytic murein transglycosylase B [Sulfuricella denitrificans skB26]|uniref:Lytic murein transglycosylase B n=1 Tax=Sulfuricella denitrificans (strain DSM 22764 / NBRC 105220 / skB26) TaxID=1163617 RepID=S6B0X7_SULDS|nr:lytic murein transglycosylase B [Sulfuricella denitrificans]BAN34342.1 lytic murein transglycosylase B [Sulfuricella denitrificans skB26]